MTVDIFKPLVEIHFFDHISIVSVKTYSIEGKPDTTPPARMKHDDLPILYFQLVDKGYSLHPDTGADGMRIIRAISPEMTEFQKTKFKIEKVL